MREGAGNWAGWTFLCGATALVLLAVAAWVAADRRIGWGAALAALAVVPFAAAAVVAGRYWRRRLDERERERDYALPIASGLPLVTVAGTAGVALALLLAGARLLERLIEGPDDHRSGRRRR